LLNAAFDIQSKYSKITIETNNVLTFGKTECTNMAATSNNLHV